MTPYAVKIMEINRKPEVFFKLETRSLKTKEEEKAVIAVLVKAEAQKAKLLRNFVALFTLVTNKVVCSRLPKKKFKKYSKLTEW